MEQAFGGLALLMCCTISITVLIGSVSWLIVARRTERRLDTNQGAPADSED